MGNKGQAVFSEYTLVFFVVVAALTAMTTLVQRSFEGRVHEARNFMINTVAHSGACDGNCLAASGGVMNQEYEPYYAQSLSDVGHRENTQTGITTGNPQVIGAVYGKKIDDATTTIATSVQLPPACADKSLPKPAYCP